MGMIVTHAKGGARSQMCFGSAGSAAPSAPSVGTGFPSKPRNKITYTQEGDQDRDTRGGGQDQGRPGGDQVWNICRDCMSDEGGWAH